MSDVLNAILKLFGQNPVELSRSDDPYVAQPLAGKTAILLCAPNGYAKDGAAKALAAAGAAWSPALAEGAKADVVVMDATGCVAPADYRALYDAFHPVVKRIALNGRVLILAASTQEAKGAVAVAAARGIEGFSRSLGKELGKFGTTVNLGYVSRAATDRLDALVRFFCTPQTAYVSGQAVTVTDTVKAPGAVPFAKVLDGKVALVTGAARGIGLATAQRLAQEGAKVVCVDVPQASAELSAAAGAIGGAALALDITAADAPQKIADYVNGQFGGVDVVVHNAGITRDRTLANMPEHHWQQVVNVNFAAIVAIDEALMSNGALRDEGRVICLSSISGVAGNYGQSNYGATKAALIGYVAARAGELASRGITINAVAPGFIETPMTDAMPFATREVGKRLNSIKQGGKPRDVAELITFLSTPAVYGVTGNTIRVCGQGLVGA